MILTKEQDEIVKTSENRQIVVECVICGQTFYSLKSTKKYCSKECENASRRLKWKNRERVEREQKLMSEKECLICGSLFRPKNKSANQRTCCYNCMPEGVQLKRGDFLCKLKIMIGGECIRCGYSKCSKALEFHHIDSSKKDFTISNDHFKLQDAINEAKKCILLCANCHRELHDNLWDITELNLKGMEEVGFDLN